MREKVILVTVTFNSSQNLRVLVEHATSQSFSLERIVAVNNASNREHCDNLNKIKGDYPLVEIVESQQNLGGAGGFNLGMQYVLDNYPDCEWIWLMDDDAYPEHDTLDLLLKNKDLKDIGALCPVIKGIETGKYQFYHHKYQSRYLNRDIPVTESIDDLGEITEIEANSFVGPLIPVSVVKELGLPEAGLFIEGDDTEYTYRISRIKKIYLIKSAVVNHADLFNTGGIKKTGLWKNYYHFRNRVLFIKKYSRTKADRFKGILVLLKNCCGMVLTTSLDKRYKGCRNIVFNMMFKGVADGMKGKTGRVVDPQLFIQSLK